MYLTEEDFTSLPAGTVTAEKKVTSSGEVHYVLDAIIGLANGIGVENLRGSGLIAGETSRAYDQVILFIALIRNIFRLKILWGRYLLYPTSLEDLLVLELT